MYANLAPLDRQSARHSVVDLRRVGDTDDSRPVEGVAVRVEWRPVHRLTARAARPCCVPAAVSEAGDVADEDLIRAERVTRSGSD